MDEFLDWRDPSVQKPAEEVFSPYNPFLDPSKAPPEWFDSISDEDWDRIQEMKQRVGVGKFLTAEDRALVDRIAANRWLLMANVFGWRCGRCDAVHEYITTGCIERPMNGVNEIMLMLDEVAGNAAYTEDHVYSMIRAGSIVYISAKEAKFYLDKIVDKFGERFLTTPIVHTRRVMVRR